jgi:hypothetical protein
MLITADHRRWMAATAGSAALLTAGYVVYLRSAPFGPSGGSWPGLGFGMLGTACMLVAALLSARKRVRTWRLGAAQTWMRAHLWLGLLAVPCIWFHSGFALGGLLTTVIMALFYIIIASGVVGVILQQALPATMTRRVRVETVLGQIDYVLDGLAVDAYELVASIAGPIADAVEEQRRLTAEDEKARQQAGYWKAVARQRPAVAPAAAAENVRAAYLAQVRPYLRGGGRDAVPDLRPLLLAAPDEWRVKLDRLQGLCDEARQLALQRRLHGWLHGWLFVHAPLSLALFVLVAAHIVFALRY